MSRGTASGGVSALTAEELRRLGEALTATERNKTEPAIAVIALP